MSADADAEWVEILGARVKTPFDAKDDVLRHVLESARQCITRFPSETDGETVAMTLKRALDERWEPSWHVVVGRSFGSYVTHETHCFLFFYMEERAFLVFKSA